MDMMDARKMAKKCTWGGGMTIRNFFLEYDAELLLGVALTVCVALCHWLLGYVPDNILEKYIDLLLNGAIFAVSLFGGLLLWRHQDNVSARRTLSVLLFGWTLVAAFFMVYMIYCGIHGSNDEQGIHDWMLAVGDFLAWLLLVYPAEMLRPKWMTWKKAFLRLLPLPFLVMLDYLSPVNLNILFLLYVVYLMYALIRHIRAYHKWCEDNYSSLEDVDEHWILQYLVMVSVAGISYAYVYWFPSPAHLVTQRALLLFILAYSAEQALFRPDPWRDVRSNKRQQSDVDVNDEDETLDSQVPELPNEVYCETLETWMKNEKPFLNPEFRLLDLRQVLPLNRTYLSRLINEEYGCTFHQFVTNYRIKEAKRLMHDNPDMKIQEVAEQSGFSSPTVFGRIFARETGMTPREWNTKSDNS